MKKTLTVNLGGTVFHIDEDAYRLLDNYLSNLKLHFRKQQGADEIVDDMETRISELFGEKLASGAQVITIADVEEIIARMGKPEDMDDTEAGAEAASEPNWTRYNAHGNESRGSYRQLYRNPDDKVLGGVASGVAAYFGWDPTIVRLLLVLMLLIPYFSIVWLYIILWIVIPEARTAAQKLHMRGENVTVENIGKTVTDGFERVSSDVKDFMQSDKPRSFLQKLGDVLVQLLGFLAKAFLVMLAVVFSPVLFVLAIVFVALIAAAIAVMVGGGAALFGMLPAALEWSPLMEASPALTLAGSISGIVVVGVPLLGLVYAILRQVFNWSPMNAGLKWGLFILWIIAIVVCFFSMATLGWPHPFLILGA